VKWLQVEHQGADARAAEGSGAGSSDQLARVGETTLEKATALVMSGELDRSADRPVE
jgi:hypothetical protein